jgi:ParB family chromosome partitioning protein
MKRRDVVRALLTPEPGELAASTAPPVPSARVPSAPVPSARVPSQAVRAMGLEIGRLTAAADEAAVLREQLLAGSAVLALDPARIEPSFVADRLAPAEDADYRRLVESMRESGQQAPILVRPHPDRPGQFQVAYGHRRRLAALELGIKVRAIVRPLGDAELVVAQGKENAERRNLSFIERACFAAALAARGFDRRTLNAALGVHSAEMTRFLAVAASVPAGLVRAIGPAPRAGRPRWMELAGLLARPDAPTIVASQLRSPAFLAVASDARLDLLLAALRDRADAAAVEIIRNARGEPVIRVERLARGMKLSLDERLAPGLGAFLLSRLPELLDRFDRQATAASDAAAE